MSGKPLVLIAFVFIIASCNFKLFVDKKYVVQHVQGFLVFRGENEATFYPTKDTVDAKFLADKKKKEGYRVEFNTGWLDSLSVDYSYISTIKGVRLSIIPVEVTYYLGDAWQKEDEQNSIEYNWEDKLFVLRFKQHDWRQILMIAVVREQDKKRLKELNLGPFPLHY